MSTVYELDLSGYYEVSAEERHEGTVFFRAHDLDPRRVKADQIVRITRDADGRLWLNAWLFDVNDQGRKIVAADGLVEGGEHVVPLKCAPPSWLGWETVHETFVAPDGSVRIESELRTADTTQDGTR